MVKLSMSMALVVAGVLALWATAGWANEPFDCVVDTRDWRTICGLDALKKAVEAETTDRLMGIEHCADETCWLERTPAPLPPGVQTLCEQKMEAVMRAMEPYREEPRYLTITAPETTTAMTFNDRFYFDPMPDSEPRYTPPQPKTLEQQIDEIERKAVEDVRDLKRRYAKGQEEAGQHIVDRAKRVWAFAEWDAVKQECWRHP